MVTTCDYPSEIQCKKLTQGYFLSKNLAQPAQPPTQEIGTFSERASSSETHNSPQEDVPKWYVHQWPTWRRQLYDIICLYAWIPTDLKISAALERTRLPYPFSDWHCSQLRGRLKPPHANFAFSLSHTSSINWCNHHQNEPGVNSV